MSAHANHPSYTAMERLIQQTTIVRQCLNQENAKSERNIKLGFVGWASIIFFEGLSEKLKRGKFERISGKGQLRLF
ncbi:hypothetical protein CRYUN_Cryun27aG0101500 [Craigia yunnanensis]